MKLVTIKNKGICFFTVLALVMLAQAFTTHRQADAVYSEAVEYNQRYQPLLEHALKLQVAVIQVQQWLTDISATRGLDGLNDGFDEAKASARVFRESVQQLSQLDSEHRQAYLALLPVFETYYSSGIRMAEAYIADGPAAGNPMMAQFDKAAADIYGEIDRLLKKSQQDAIVSTETLISSAETSKNLGDLFLVMMLLLMSLLVVGIYHYIFKPIRKMQLMVDQLSEGEVDLTQQLSLQGYDELSQLGHGFNRFIKRSDEMVSGIIGSVQEMVPLSQSLAGTNQLISQQAKEQSEKSQAVRQSIDATGGIASQVYDEACKINEAAGAGNLAVEEGNSVVTHVSSCIRDMSEQMQSAGAAVSQLKSDSESVASVIDVINNIAEKTNLLALNAAIEAARAGESGRGFAVVADEVRNLAAKTRQSTMEVQQIVEAIQSGTLQVVEAMENGQSHALDNSEEMEKAIIHLQNLQMTINDISGSAEEIVESVALQNQNFSEVSSSFDMIDDGLNQALEEGQSSVAFSQDMTQLSEDLNEQLAVFRVSGT